MQCVQQDTILTLGRWGLSACFATWTSDVHDGLPELTPSLRWDSQTQLYVAGRARNVAGRADALNLGGAASASRIISDILASA